jgi:hypothetical protein
MPCQSVCKRLRECPLRSSGRNGQVRNVDGDAINAVLCRESEGLLDKELGKHARVTPKKGMAARAALQISATGLRSSFNAVMTR